MAYEQKTAIRFIDHVLSKLPFKVEKVQTDDGSEFGRSLHWHLLDKGFDHIRIKPPTPRLNGKVEPFHRIDSVAQLDAPLVEVVHGRDDRRGKGGSGRSKVA